MKRPVTLVLLMVFLAVQLYFAKRPIAHQVGGTTWLAVAATPSAMVERAGRYFLVSPTRYYRLNATSTHLTATPALLNWEEVPQPSGRGIWKMAYSGSGLSLMGTGGPIYPSPQGLAVLWQDPGNGQLFHSVGKGSALMPLTATIHQVQKVLWAADGNATALLGEGVRGMGLYILDGDGHLAPAIIPGSNTTIQTFGFTRKETLLAELGNGQFVWQAHSAPTLPALQNVQIDNGNASIWGSNQQSTVLWIAGHSYTRPKPDVTWEGKAAFSPNGTEVASLATNENGQPVCYLAGPHSQLTINLPFANGSHAHLLGFMGNHWVLVANTAGSHTGTYAWWINTL